MPKIKKDERFEAKEKQEYSVTNWPEYNKALENRGNITFLISDEVIDDWYSNEPLQQGAQEKYSDTCIEAIIMFKTVFRLAYRQARGFTQGILKLMKLEHLDIPSFTQVNRKRPSNYRSKPFDLAHCPGNSSSSRFTL
jgi:hypothetical protein